MGKNADTSVVLALVVFPRPFRDFSAVGTTNLFSANLLSATLISASPSPTSVMMMLAAAASSVPPLKPIACRPTVAVLSLVIPSFTATSHVVLTLVVAVLAVANFVAHLLLPLTATLTYSWIANQRDTHEKLICQQTRSAKTIPRPPLGSSRQEKSRSSGYIFCHHF